MMAAGAMDEHEWPPVPSALSIPVALASLTSEWPRGLVQLLTYN